MRSIEAQVYKVAPTAALYLFAAKLAAIMLDVGDDILLLCKVLQ